jgi:hypothetical protein
MIQGLILRHNQRRCLLFFLFGFPRFEDQGVCHKLPQIFYLHVHHIVFLPEAFHDLVAAVMAGCDEQLGPRVFDLLGFGTAVEDPLLHVGRRPGTAACAAADVVGPIRIHVHEILAALLGHPSGLFIVSMPEYHLRFPSIVAWIMVSGQFVMNGFVEFDAPLFYVFLEKIMDTEVLDTGIFIPKFETNTGREVCVSSLG